MPDIRVMHVGLGPVGAAVVKQIKLRRGLKSVAAVDIDPAKVGRDLGDVAGLGTRLGVPIADDIVKAAKTAKPDVVALCTGSSVKGVLPQIEAILAARRPIVSTTEELSYPGHTHVRHARRIDSLARKAREDLRSFRAGASVPWRARGPMAR